jgi:putative ABC transport system ATP-binding protein
MTSTTIRFAPALSLSHVDKRYPGSPPVQPLRDVCLDLQAGESLAITGPSGSGKTTLLHVLATLERADGGRIHLVGQPVHALKDPQLAALRAHHIGIVFQRFHLLDTLTALDNVATGLLYQGHRSTRRRLAAAQALNRVGLANRLRHRPAQLSGGEQQRVAIARAIVRQPTLLLADEPTGNLDSRAAEEILDLLTDLNRDGTTLIVVSHDESVASRLRRRIRFRDGAIVSDDTP